MYKTKKKTYEELEQELTFLKTIIDTVPATVHVLRLDKDFNTLPVWANKGYERILGYSLEERQKLGFAGNNGSVYYADDIKSIKESVTYLLKHPDRTGAIFFRIKRPDNSPKWLYMVGKQINYKSSKDVHVLCLGIDISRQLGTNDVLVNAYLKEIAQLKNQLSLCKLSKTELNITKLFAKGLSAKEIASKLHRSYDTINNHKRHIFEKMGFHKVTELVHFAEECGLV